jgi:hypothetical protein
VIVRGYNLDFSLFYFFRPPKARRPFSVLAVAKGQPEVRMGPSLAGFVPAGGAGFGVRRGTIYDSPHPVSHTGALQKDATHRAKEGERQEQELAELERDLALHSEQADLCELELGPREETITTRQEAVQHRVTELQVRSDALERREVELSSCGKQLEGPGVLRQP